MSDILAAGVVFGASEYFDDPDPAQPALREARHRHGHALCLCVKPHRQLVIREVRGTLYLAVWPNDGAHHAPVCPFYREAEPVDQQGDRGRGAVLLNQDGLWDVAVDLPRRRADAKSPGLSSPASSSPAQTANQQAVPVRSPARPTVALHQFLLWLWDNASLTRWATGWTRDWWRVMRSVRHESAGVVIDGVLLSDVLFIPPPFRKDKEAEIRDDFQQFLAPLVKSAREGAAERPFVLAEVKAMEPTQFGYKVALKHMAHPVFVDRDLYASMAKQSALAMSLLPRRKELRCSVVGLFLVEVTAKGNMRAVSAAMLLTSEKYVPVQTIYELELANRMTDENRTFSRTITPDSHGDFILRDSKVPISMEIYSLLTPDYVQRKDARCLKAIAEGCAVWKWEPAAAQPLPPLPPQEG